MKKAIFTIAVVALTVISCKEEAPIDYAVVSGKIANATKTEVLIASYNDRNKIDTLQLAADGTFTDTIKAAKGQYRLINDRNYKWIYLENGFNLTLNADAKDFDKSLTMTGTGLAENDYFKAKREKETEFRKGDNPYTLDEAKFKEKMSAQKTALDALVDTAQGVSDSFKAAQKKDNNYGYLASLGNFENTHQYYSKNPDFKVSDGFLSEMDALDFENIEDFENSQSYKQLLSAYYSKEASKLVTDDLPKDVAVLKAIGKIKNETIKNGLLEQSVFGVTITEKLDEYYNAFMAASTDEKQRETVKGHYDKLKAVEAGQPSPKFVNYENFAGGTTSLDDLKGKYVYIDVWATWCGPCIAEIPFLKEVEKAYHGKNIAFVSLSVDRPDAYEKWKQMIKDRELGGIQIIADNNFESKFVKDYVIQGIPKFILLDPEGKIINANALRPSNPKLREILDELL